MAELADLTGEDAGKGDTRVLSRRLTDGEGDGRRGLALEKEHGRVLPWCLRRREGDGQLGWRMGREVSCHWAQSRGGCWLRGRAQRRGLGHGEYGDC